MVLALNNPFAQDYDGEKGDIEAGREYFKNCFARIAQEDGPNGKGKSKGIHI